MNKDFLLIYVVSDVRSGSTILGKVFENYTSAKFIGELHWFEKMLSDNWNNTSIDRFCSCNETYINCVFWKKILAKIPKERQFNFRTLIKIPKNRLLKFLYNIFLIFPFFRKCIPYMNINREIIQNSEVILKNISKEFNYQILVETSKEPERAKFYDILLKENVKFIFLIRDGRAVTYSKMKRGVGFYLSCFSWLFRNFRQFIIQLSIPKNRRVFIKYEEFQKDPELVIKKVLTSLDRGLKTTNPESHFIGGSKLKSKNKTYSIIDDSLWRSSFNGYQLVFLNIITFLYNLILGYPLWVKKK